MYLPADSIEFSNLEKGGVRRRKTKSDKYFSLSGEFQADGGEQDQINPNEEQENFRSQTTTVINTNEKIKMVREARKRIEEMHPLRHTPFELSFPQIGFIFAAVDRLWFMVTKKPVNTWFKKTEVKKSV